MITREELDALLEILSRTPLTKGELLWINTLLTRWRAMIQAAEEATKSAE